MDNKVFKTAKAMKKTLHWGPPKKPQPKSLSLAQALYPHLPRGEPPEPKPKSK